MVDLVLIGAAGTAAGAIITAISMSIVNIRNQKHKENIELNKQSLEVYASVIQSLKKDIELNIKDLNTIRESNLSCREKTAAMSIQIKYLEAENAQLRKQIESR